MHFCGVRLGNEGKLTGAHVLYVSALMIGICATAPMTGTRSLAFMGQAPVPLSSHRPAKDQFLHLSGDIRTKNYKGTLVIVFQLIFQSTSVSSPSSLTSIAYDLQYFSPSTFTMAPPASLPTKPLGKTGRQVPALGFGMMGLSAAYGPFG